MGSLEVVARGDEGIAGGSEGRSAMDLRVGLKVLVGLLIRVTTGSVVSTFGGKTTEVELSTRLRP